MTIIVLDTNVLRGMPDSELNDLVAMEQAKGITLGVDLWTLLELFANLAEPNEPAYWPSRKAIRRLAIRTLGSPSAGILLPAEAQICLLIFGTMPPGMEETSSALISACDVVGKAADDDPLPELTELIAKCRAEVAAKEEWFSKFFAATRDEVTDLISSHDPPRTSGELRNEVRVLLRSSIVAELDAAALLTRAYGQMGRPTPDPLPDGELKLIVRACNAGITATATVLERLLVDGADPAKQSFRNYLWDQEIAFQIGQLVGDDVVVLVSDDGFFADVAARAGVGRHVRTLAAHRTSLGASEP